MMDERNHLQFDGVGVADKGDGRSIQRRLLLLLAVLYQPLVLLICHQQHLVNHFFVVCEVSAGERNVAAGDNERVGDDGNAARRLNGQISHHLL